MHSPHTSPAASCTSSIKDWIEFEDWACVLLCCSATVACKVASWRCCLPVQMYTYYLRPVLVGHEATLSGPANGGEGHRLDSSSVGDSTMNAAFLNEGLGDSVHSWEVQLVLEYCDQGSLRSLLNRKGAFSLPGGNWNGPHPLQQLPYVSLSLLCAGGSSYFKNQQVTRCSECSLPASFICLIVCLYIC